MEIDKDGPTLPQAILRLGTMAAIAAFIAYTLWDIFTESAALHRLASTVENYTYTQSCDGDGNLLETGDLNCIDLGQYVFIHGTVNKVLRRSCTGKPAALLTLEKGQAERVEINRIARSLEFRARGASPTPCRT